VAVPQKHRTRGVQAQLTGATVTAIPPLAAGCWLELPPEWVAGSGAMRDFAAAVDEWKVLAPSQALIQKP